jgi:hypothetical protein
MIDSPTTDEQAFQVLCLYFQKALIAEFVGVSKQAVSKWKSVPPRYVKVLSEKTGFPREELLPSMYR